MHIQPVKDFTAESQKQNKNLVHICQSRFNDWSMHSILFELCLEPDKRTRSAVRSKQKTLLVGPRKMSCTWVSNPSTP